jgi:hypothetical protein
MNKKIKLMVALVTFCGAFATVSSVKSDLQAGKLWAGLSYWASKNGATAEAGLAIGIAGVADSAIQGAAWGMVYGGPAGVAAGVVAGL